MNTSLLEELNPTQNDYGSTHTQLQQANGEDHKVFEFQHPKAVLNSLDQLAFVIIYFTYCKDFSFMRMLITSLIQLLIKQVGSPMVNLPDLQSHIPKLGAAKTGLRLYVILLGVNNIFMHLLNYGLVHWTMDFHEMINPSPFLTQTWDFNAILTQWIGETSTKSITMLLILDILLILIQLIEVGAIGAIHPGSNDDVVIDL